MGFDSLWVMDHPLTHADPFVAQAAVLAATERLVTGSLVLAAPYRHPAVTARMQLDLQNLSGGRSVLGIGSGWFRREYEAMQLAWPPIKSRQQTLDEVLEIVTRLWTGDPVEWQGEWFGVSGMQLSPIPEQRPAIMIGGSGELKTLAQVARWADACNIREAVPAGDPPDRDEERIAEVRQKLAALHGHLAALGRPGDEVLRTHYTTYLVMAATQEEAERKADRVDTANSPSAGTRTAGRRFLFAASPERAIAYYRALVDAGVQYFVVQVDADDRETIDLFGTHVLTAGIGQ